ncbi:hypothetical protein NKH18_47905 [Streptomyces sp. M10(2022)]
MDEPADLAVDSGQCLLDLGQLDDASAKMREGLSLLPKAGTRHAASS